MSVPIDPDAYFVTTIKPANNATRTPRAATAGNSLSGSIIDNAITHPVSTAIATVNTIKFSIHFRANLVDTISMAIITLNAATAAIPLISFPVSTWPNKIATAANIAIENDIIKRVVPTLFNSLSGARFIAYISATIMALKAIITAMPLIISLSFIPAISLTTIAIINIEAAMLNIVFPRASILFPPTNLVAAIRPTIITLKASIASVPLIISSSFSPANSLTVKPMSNIATAICEMAFPIPATLLPAALETYINTIIIADNNAKQVKPCLNASGSILPSNFTSKPNISKETASFKIVAPTAAMVLLALPSNIFCITAITKATPTSNVATPTITWPALSGSILSIIFIAAAISNIDTESDMHNNEKAAKSLAFPDPNFPIRIVAATIRPNTAVNSKMAIQAFPQSRRVNTQIDPTIRATAIARLFMACILILKDKAPVNFFIHFEKSLIAFEALFKTDPIPANGSEKF